MTPKQTIILFFLFYNLSLFSQNNNLVLDSLLTSNKHIKHPDSLAKTYYNISKKYYNTVIDISLHFALLVDSIGKQNNTIKEGFYLKNFRNLPKILNKKRLYKEAIFYGENYLKTLAKETKEHISVYRNLGNSYNDVGDLNKAIPYYEKAIYLSKKKNSLKEEAKSSMNLIEVFVRLEDTSYKKNAHTLLNRIDVISKAYKLSKQENIAIRLNSGAFFDILKDYHNAKKQFKKALVFSKKHSDSLNIFKSLTNLAIIYRKEKNYEAALSHLNKAKGFTNNNLQKQASLHNNLADVYKDANDYKKALNYYNKAISYSLGFLDTTIYSIPNIEDLSLTINKVNLLDYIIDKANLIVLMDTINSKDLEHALQLYNAADEILDVIYFESRNGFSKLFWREHAANFYINAVDIAHRLNNTEKAFYYIEKSKALLLLENITDNKAKELVNLPRNLIDREYKLLQEIKKTNALLLNNIESITIIDSIKDEVFMHKLEYTNFIDSLELKYPTYYTYKSKVAVYNSKMAQKNIKDNEIILQYILSNNKGYISVVNKHDITIHKLNNLEHLDADLNTFKTLIGSPFTDKTDRENYKTIAYKLFKSLFPFKNNLEVLKNKQVIIIPSGKLQHIPFEALITNTIKPLPDSYLLNICNINYAYSYSSLINLSKTKYNIKQDAYAISPIEFKTKNLPLLNMSKTDIKNIEQLLSTTLIKKHEASKLNFINAYGNYKIIHISTHGSIENNTPWLAFNDDRLMLDEIYFKDKKAELVVLSACKTSQGELKKGEGVMSIARGFTNAGAQSIVSSLWDLNKKSSDEIIFDFYKNIKAKDSKSLALKKAKLAYLNKNKNTSEASPYYWSSIILIGNDSPIIFKDKTSLHFIEIGVIVMVLFITYFIVTNKCRKTRIKND